MIGQTGQPTVMESGNVPYSSDNAAAQTEFERETGIANTSADLVAFCRSRRITKELKCLADLVRRHMHAVTALQCRFETDPDSEASWAVIDVTVNDPATLLNDYDAVVHQWVKSADARSRDLIKFTFSLA